MIFLRESNDIKGNCPLPGARLSPASPDFVGAEVASDPGSLQRSPGFGGWYRSVLGCLAGRHGIDLEPLNGGNHRLFILHGYCYGWLIKPRAWLAKVTFFGGWHLDLDVH